MEIRNIKDNLYYILVEKNKFIKQEYDAYVKENIDKHNTHRLLHWWILIRLNWHYRILKNDYSLIEGERVTNKFLKTGLQIDFYSCKTPRKSIDEWCELLQEYEIISFDIFDTVLYRKVEKPEDVFNIMAIEIGHNDFVNIRKKAEQEARDLADRDTGSREVTLTDIYDILENNYGIERKWENREVELELELATPNPYMKTLFEQLTYMGKRIIFTSDMYLSKTVLEEILHKIGYTNYEEVYVSNEYKMRKGDGKLQKMLLDKYSDTKIVHIGDNYNSDFKKSNEVGLAAIHNPGAKLPYRENDMDNLGGSFYRAIINNYLNNGLWEKSLYFEHGFRVGGILTVGFCEYINKVVHDQKIDKILFCSRDCEVIWKTYNRNFKECDNEYIQISRYSIMNVTSERYLYDLANRFILRYIEQNKTTKTIETIFKECGFEYLIEYLEYDHIDKFLFPSSIEKKQIERFIYRHKAVIEKHNESNKKAAVKYFDSVIKDAKNILIIDIGWSGTCTTALKYFIETNLPRKNRKIIGALMCTSRGNALTASISSGEIDAYIYSPYSNMDLTRFMMPGGNANKTAKAQDLLHMPLEFMYTSTERSLAFYKEDVNGEIIFERMGSPCENADEIEEIQSGIMYFSDIYIEYIKPYKKYFSISPYVAFNPMKSAIENTTYCYNVYKNFTYDAFTAPYVEDGMRVHFGSLFDKNIEKKGKKNKVKNSETSKKKILFITPELVYTGAPRSLLRMCKVATDLGYQPCVWSAKYGPFIQEYNANDIEVQIVPEKDLRLPSIIRELKTFDMAVCNTIVTDKYAKVCSGYIPTVWYIREATNIPDFIRNDTVRAYTLKHSKNIYCVSDYAADAIGKYTTNKIRVVHNSVEDEISMASPYVAGTGEKVRFVQFGTIEYRKGYDVLLSAYLAMPKEYQDKAEINFAGGFINSGTPYCSYLFNKMEKISNVHYLGVVRGEENKIRTLSEMDVVVVASRDESCSLVALEGAMLSKPLIVTENVGAKYMVNDQNGVIVKTDDVVSLRDAMMYMIDNKAILEKMGIASRREYEKSASMKSYTCDMERMFALTKEKTSISFFIRKHVSRIENNFMVRKGNEYMERIQKNLHRNRVEKVIVSLTSHPGRIDTTNICIKSLLNQRCKPLKVLLWLSKEQFPNGDDDLPTKLLQLKKNSLFEIKWVQEDIKPHKKYFYAMQEYPKLPIIIVDDDVIYENTLVEKLMDSYRKFPYCISCMRANLMMFNKNGAFRAYEGWIKGYKLLLDIPSYQLMATGVGGVLYPPKSLPIDAFSIETIKEKCLYTDDLWLKLFSVKNGYMTVVPRESCQYREIEGTNETALWRINVNKNNNDVSLMNILNYFEETEREELLKTIREDRFR